MTGGLSADIYKNSDGWMGCDCTLNGISSNYTRATLYPTDSISFDGPIDYDDPDTANLWIMEHPRVPGYLVALPSPDDAEFHEFQFGGNFVHSSDSRFPSKQPIPIHDRQEENPRRMSVKEIFALTDQLHASFNWLDQQEQTNEVIELKGKLSSQISEIGKKYQEVLNKEQRKRVFEGPEKNKKIPEAFL